MSAFALVIAEAIEAKYIVPTDIAMVYGILDKKEIMWNYQNQVKK